MAFRKKAREVAPKFAVTDLGGGEAEIVLYGDIVEDERRDWITGEPRGNEISAERFNRELEQIRGARHVTVRLNSVGGDAYTGVAIYTALRSLDADVTVRIDGIAASAASAIACAGDQVVVSPCSIFMIHEARVGLFGYYGKTDFEALENDLDATNRSLANIYEAKCRRSRSEVESMMSDETWMVGQEIVDAGFADVMEGDGEEVTEPADGDLVIAGIRHDLSAYRNVPEDLAARVAAADKRPSASVAVANRKEPPSAAKQTKGAVDMTLEELRSQHPDLVAQIELAAVESERERLAKIDEIAEGIPADLVASAKYVEPCTAQELAFKAMLASKATAKANAEKDEAGAKAYSAAIASDAAESGASSVACAPNAGVEEHDDEEEAKAVIGKMAGVFAKMKGGK